jgi:Ca2+-transporting ATPase
MLVATVSASFAAQLALVYIPLLQAVFQTEALSLRDLFMVLSLAGSSFAAHEIRRRWERKRERDGWRGGEMA